MKRKDYMKPTMDVVEVRTESHLLAASNGETRMKDYEWNDYEEE